MREFVLAVLSFTLLLATGCDQQRIASLEKDNADLKTQVAKQSATANSDLQEKCAKDAQQFFRQGWRNEKGTQYLDYVNHYNKKENICFISVEEHITANGRMWWNIETIWNVFENSKVASIQIDMYPGQAPDYQMREVDVSGVIQE